MNKLKLLIPFILLHLSIKGQTYIEIKDTTIHANSIQLFPMHGAIELKRGQSIKPILDSGGIKTYTLQLSYPIEYVQIIRNEKAVLVPLSGNQQTYFFENAHNNHFSTDNLYYNTFRQIDQLAHKLLNPFRDSLFRFDKRVLDVLPIFLDSSETIIEHHPFKMELEYIYNRTLVYELQKKLSTPKGKRKLNSVCLKELNQTKSMFEFWGYNNYLNTLLEDYYHYHMNMFNYPFRLYKTESLKTFIFDEGIFTKAELNDYLSFYKIKRLENTNDKNVLFYFADSLRQTTNNLTLEREIGFYLERAEKRTKPLATAPNFFLKEVGADKIYRLNDFQDKVVILDFWATWCGPCVKSFKSVKRLNEQYKDKVHFIGISVDANESKVISFLELHPEYNWRFLHDGQGGATSTVYEASSIPKYVIIGQDGILIIETNDVKKVEEWLKSNYKESDN